MRSVLLAASRLASSLSARSATPAVDLVLLVSEWNRGWASDRTALEIDRHFSGSSRVSYVAPLFTGLYLKRWSGHTAPPHIQRLSFAARLRSRRLPSARTLFIEGPHLLHKTLFWNPHLWHARKVVLYTHAEVPHAGPGGALSQLRGADFLLTMNRISRDVLISDGWPSDRIATLTWGANPDRFCPHARGEGAVGLCSAFYPRKGPERVLEVVGLLPNRRFILLGRGWPAWERFGELLALPNFEYVEIPYEEYPKWYAKMDVFLSTSLNEEGPLPLLEAMLSNCVPVASRTGFAPDIITHGQNGFVFDTDAPVADVCSLIEDALRLRADVRATVEHLTWKRFTNELSSYLFPE